MTKKKPVDKQPESGVTRRGFLGSVGAGAAAVATGVTSRAEAVPEITVPEEMLQIALKINGRLHRLLVEPRWTLLFVLRDRLGITGTKAACERGECGSCSVLIDDLPRYACMTLAVEADNISNTFYGTGDFAWIAVNEAQQGKQDLNGDKDFVDFLSFRSRLERLMPISLASSDTPNISSDMFSWITLVS